MNKLTFGITVSLSTKLLPSPLSMPVHYHAMRFA